MALIVEAVYQQGVLKLSQLLPLQENERVEITIKPITSWVEETAGILGWQGGSELAEQFASDAELAFPPPAEEP